MCVDYSQCSQRAEMGQTKELIMIQRLQWEVVRVVGVVAAVTSLSN